MVRLIACFVSLVAFLGCAGVASAAVVVDIQTNTASVTSDGEPLNLTVSLTRAGDGYVLRVTDLGGGTPRSSLVLAGTAFGACPTGASPSEIVCELAIWDATWPVAVQGTPGNDSIKVLATAKANLPIAGAAGNDTVDVQSTDFLPSIDLGDGDDVLVGCGCGVYDLSAELVLRGGAGADTFTAEQSTSALTHGWFGTYVIAPDFETVIGSPQADYLDLPSVTRIVAGRGNDEVTSPSRNATILLGDGNDRFVDDALHTFAHDVRGGAGSDTVTATTHKGDRTICLDPRPSVCAAFDGRKGERDRIGEDVENVDLRGARGNHLVVGSRHANRIQTGAGNDTFFGGDGADVFIGGAGFDAVVYSYRPLQPRSVHLTADGRSNDGGPREDRVSRDIEILVGSVFGDVIVGSGGHEGLYGHGGNDVITGGRGSDYLDGGPGNDVINARDGRRDEIACGAGRDTVRADANDKVAPDCEIR